MKVLKLDVTDNLEIRRCFIKTMPLSDRDVSEYKEAITKMNNILRENGFDLLRPIEKFEAQYSFSYIFIQEELNKPLK